MAKSSGFTGDDRDIAHSTCGITPHRIQPMALSTGRGSNRPPQRIS